jgi:hypothetical protein
MTEAPPYLERKKKSRRATDAFRCTMALLARFFEWRQALTIVKPDTRIRWHRKGFRLFWKWKSRPGRPRIPQELRQLIEPTFVKKGIFAEDTSEFPFSVLLGRPELFLQL